MSLSVRLQLLLWMCGILLLRDMLPVIQKLLRWHDSKKKPCKKLALQAVLMFVLFQAVSKLSSRELHHTVRQSNRTCHPMATQPTISMSTNHSFAMAAKQGADSWKPTLVHPKTNRIYRSPTVTVAKRMDCCLFKDQVFVFSNKEEREAKKPITSFMAKERPSKHGIHTRKNNSKKSQTWCSIKHLSKTKYINIYKHQNNSVKRWPHFILERCEQIFSCILPSFVHSIYPSVFVLSVVQFNSVVFFCQN